MDEVEQERPEDAARKFAQQLNAIEELHQPDKCRECGKPWPCPTILRVVPDFRSKP